MAVRHDKLTEHFNSLFASVIAKGNTDLRTIDSYAVE